MQDSLPGFNAPHVGRVHVEQPDPAEANQTQRYTLRSLRKIGYGYMKPEIEIAIRTIALADGIPAERVEAGIAAMKIGAGYER